MSPVKKSNLMSGKWTLALIDLQVYKARKQSGGETTGIGKSISGRRKKREGKTHEREKKPSRHMTAAGPSKHLERANSLKHCIDSSGTYTVS